MSVHAVLRATVALLLAGALSGCGGGSGGGSSGGGGGGGGGGSGGGTGAAFAQRQPEFDALAADIDSRPNTVALPSGSARYQGGMGLTVLDGTTVRSEMLGDLELNANFDTGRITGRAKDFVGYNGLVRGASPEQLRRAAYTASGELTVTAEIEDGGVLRGTSSGRLTPSGGEAGQFELGVAGRFRGNNASHLAAGAAGTVLSDRGVERNVTGSLAGVRAD